MSKVLVLDCETENAIQGKNEQRIPGIKYAEGGWSDYLGMGISCIGAWESWTDRYRVFAKPPKSDSLNEIKSDYPLTESIERAEFIVTFNGISFDGNLLLKHSVVIPSWKHIDLLVELREKQGYDKYQKGFKLDDVAGANGLPLKTGSGAHAPVLWQQGKYCEVIDYCLNDIWLLKELIERAVRGHLVHPKSMVHTIIDLPFKSITRPFQYQTELPGVVDGNRYSELMNLVSNFECPECSYKNIPEIVTDRENTVMMNILCPCCKIIVDRVYIGQNNPHKITELPAVVDPISPIKNPKYLYVPGESISNPVPMQIDPVIKKVFDDLNERHREGGLSDDDYRKINAYFGDVIAPLPPHLRPENLN